MGIECTSWMGPPRGERPPCAEASAQAAAAAQLAAQAAPLGAGRGLAAPAVALVAERSHVARGVGRAGERFLQRLQRRAGSGVAAGAPQRALELGERGRSPAAVQEREDAAAEQQRGEEAETGVELP